ncbi:ribonuclease H-like domain-containing protein [Tanacetum coccineum]
MDLETAQTNTTAKLPILKQGKYEMWRLRIEKYFQVQDYALWDVIENDNSFKPTTQTTANDDGTYTSMIPCPVTTEEKAQKKNDVKARSMLLMALPNEHQLTFNQYKDAKTLFDAIQIRFGGNDATRKTQKTLLKQMYENFNASSTESLDSIFNRLQKIVSQLAILDLDTMSIDDLYNNFKIVEQEVKRTVTSSSNSNSSSQNMAFVSSPNSTNEVNTANVQVSTANSPVSTADTPDSTANLSDATVYAFLANQPNGSQLVHEDLEQIHEDDLEEMDLKWQLALLSIRARRYFQRTGKKITINRSDTARYDKSKVECFNCHKMGHFARECRGPRNQDNRNRNQDSSRRTVNVEETSSKAMVAIDGAGFDWSFMADEEVPTNMALMAFSDSEVHNDKTCTNTCLKSFETLKTQYDNLRIEFNKSEFNLATYKRGLTSVEEQLVFYKKNKVMFCDQIAVLKRDTSFKDSEINALKSEIEKLKKEKESNQIKIDKFENASKSLDKLIGSQISDNSRKGVGFVSYNVVPPPPTDLFTPLTIDLSNSGLEEFQQPEFEGYGPKAHCNYHQKEGMVNGNNYTRVNYNYSAKKAHPNSYRNTTPRAVLMKIGPKSLNIGRPVNTAHPKTTIYRARPMSCFSKLSQSIVKRPYQSRIELTNKNSNKKVNTPKEKVYTAKPKAVNTARPTSAVVNAVRANKGHSQKEDQGYVDSGCSRHMIGNMSYLSDFKEFDRGYVTFRGGARGGWNYCIRISLKWESNTKPLETPQQNGVAEMRNRTLIEAARTMLADSKLPTTFWAEAVNTTCYVQNRVIIVKPHNKTPYELFRGRTPALSFMRPFGCHVFNTLDHLGKFDGKFDDGFFVGYSLTSNGPKWLFDLDSLTKSMNYVPVVTSTNSNDFASSEESNGAGHTSKETEFSQDYIVMPLNAKKKDDEGVSKASGFSDQEQFERSTPNINTAGPSINNASANSKTGSLNINIVSPTVITTRSNHSQNVSDMFSLGRSATLEATHADLFGNETEMDMSNLTTSYQVLTTPNTRIHKDHSLDHVIVFAPVARIEAIRLFLAYASFMGFMVYQMDIKTAFHYGTIKEEVYVCQPLRFEDPDYPDKVYKVVKALYGLHQAPRACQDKYVAKILRKFSFTDVKTASTPMDSEKPLLKDSDVSYIIETKNYVCSQPKLGLWYPRNSPFDLVAYSDSDYAGASLDRKSTTGGCQFLGYRLISWKCKKQTVVDTSSTEAEHVTVASCFRQVLWIQNQIPDYRQIIRGRDTKISQSSGPFEKVGDEAVDKELGDRMERAATTASSLEAEHGIGNNNRTQSMAKLNESSP